MLTPCAHPDPSKFRAVSGKFAETSFSWQAVSQVMSPYSFSKGLQIPCCLSFLLQRESPKMFITRLLSSKPRRGHPRNLKRNFASISILTRVPATIYRLQQGPRSNLLAPHPEAEGIPIDEVQVDRDGLVKTGLSLKEPCWCLWTRYVGPIQLTDPFANRSVQWSDLYAQHSSYAGIDQRCFRCLF